MVNPRGGKAPAGKITRGSSKVIPQGDHPNSTFCRACNVHLSDDARLRGAVADVPTCSRSSLTQQRCTRCAAQQKACEMPPIAGPVRVACDAVGAARRAVHRARLHMRAAGCTDEATTSLPGLCADLERAVVQMNAAFNDAAASVVSPARRGVASRTASPSDLSSAILEELQALRRESAAQTSLLRRLVGKVVGGEGAEEEE